jgi:Flp pilus assembly CpaE family ATPase
MSNREQIQIDIAIGFEFVEKIIQNPELLDQVPNDAEISFLDSGNPKLESPKQENSNKKYVKVGREFLFL